MGTLSDKSEGQMMAAMKT